ncbi:MAG: hypothetical protein KQ78_01933 [Candidatus Izimaplasma bacterium HR2]|nr:MAG: hypothetical protein KQ78_01933 [Candidatus Izimaplasma bacterium HR2]
MNRKKSNKKIKVGVFSREDLLKNSPGKAGKHMDVVRMGTGRHKSKKDYTRKQKHKKNTRDLL